MNVSISSRVKNRIIDAINTRMAGLGTDADTAMPRSKNNRDGIAWEYYISNHILRMAASRTKRAETAAIKAGVIFDKDKKPRAVGTNETVYLGEHMNVLVTVMEGSSHLDERALEKFLISHKVNPDLVAEALEAASVKHRPSHRFVASVNLSDTTGK